MVVEGVCLLLVLIGLLGRRGTGLVGMPNEVPAAAGMSLANPRCSASPRTLRTCWRKIDLHAPWSMSKNYRCPSVSWEAIRSVMAWNAPGSSAVHRRVERRPSR